MLKWLTDNYMYLQTKPWLLFATVVLGFFIVSKLVHLIFARVFFRIAKKTKTEIDDLLIQKTEGPISWILLLLGFRIGFAILDQQTYFHYAKLIVESLLILFAVLLITRIVDVFIDSWGKGFAKKTKSQIDDQLINLLHRFFRISFWILGILFVLDLWGVKVGPLLASLGIAGLAVAFALQESLSNIFGGISLIVDKTIKVGDLVSIEGGDSGEVVDIGLRSTRIRNWDNDLVIIPNSKVANNKITNWVKPNRKSRIVLPFTIAYGSNIDKAQKAVLDAIKKVKGISKDPKPLVRFTEMKDSALEFKLYFYVDDISHRFMGISDANRLIYNALNKNKIEIPFPQMDVHVKNH